jgi:hypothetical protein
MTPRTCEYRECSTSIEHRRPQCRFCCAAHKAAEHRARRRSGGGTGGAGEKPYRNRPGRSRRPSRDGLGTRVYLTALQEISDVRAEFEREVERIARKERPWLQLVTTGRKVE